MIPRLMPCSSSPPPGETRRHEQVDQVGHRHLGLARRRRSRRARRRSRRPRTAAAPRGCGGPRRRRCVPDGDGRMKALGVAGELAPCGSCRRGSSRPSGCSTGRRRAPRPGGRRRSGAAPKASMNVDLPTPGLAADADPDGAAGARAAARRRATSAASAGWSARVDSTRVMARARARRSPARTSATPPSRSRQAAFAAGRAGGRAPGAAASGMLVPGPKTAATPASCSKSWSCGGMTPPHDHEDVARPRRRASSSMSCGHERLVAGGLAGHADDVDVVLDGVAGRLGRRLEQRADVDVEAEVGEGGGDDLGAPVVAVLAHLDHEHAGPAALAPRRRRRPRPAAVSKSSSPS